MKKYASNKFNQFLFLCALSAAILLLLAVQSAIAQTDGHGHSAKPAPKDSATTMAIKKNINDMLLKQKNISPLTDIPVVSVAGDASLTDAAYYAWQEFIALNWPAVKQTGAFKDREMPDATKKFGEMASASESAYPALVWETFRHKVEIYPGQGSPHGYEAPDKKNNNMPNTAADFGYDELPEYIYNDKDAQIIPFLGSKTPWVNLDEASQIGTNQIFTGLDKDQVAPSGPGRLLLFLAKANRSQYQYVASRGWWNTDADNPYSPADTITRTANYVANEKATPASSGLNGQLLTVAEQKTAPEYVSFPSGTIELKTAWRLATEKEELDYTNKGYIEGYHASMVRYYESTAGATITTPEQFAAKDALGVMLGLHIIHKTPSAPYFIFATFEHADNIRRADGTPLEDADGNIIGIPPASITTSEVVSTASQVQTVTLPSSEKQLLLTQQIFTPGDAEPSSFATNNQSYFINTHATQLPSDSSDFPQIGVDQRRFSIPAAVIDVNKQVHVMISTANSSASNPWGNYRLTNVQWKPLTKTPGQDYAADGGGESATYYLSNSVIETNHILSKFSGQFFGTPSNNTITDFEKPQGAENNGTQTINGVIYHKGIASGKGFDNVYYKGAGYLMGGCMGCHGNQQVSGNDFSFIFASPVSKPDSASITYPFVVQQPAALRQ